MSEVKEVRKALNRLATRNGGSEAQLLAALKDMKPGAPGISFDVGPPLSEIEAAFVSEGLAACDALDKAEERLGWVSAASYAQVVHTYGGILRKAGLM